MGIYKHNVPWSSKFAFQELNQEEKQLRRVELLLLNNPAGLFLSHIKINLHLSEGVIQQQLDKLQARNIDGFWVHPHYVFNACYRGKFPTLPESSKILLPGCQLIDAIRNSPDISITRLLRLAKIQNPGDLILLLKDQIRPNIDLESQYLAGNFLYRRFNIYLQVIC